MNRNVSLSEISDGKLYGLTDMVKVGCNDCKGCSSCCQGMGTSIVLDPYDIYRITTSLNLSLEELLVDKIELNIVEGVILPNLKMVTETKRCAFLNEEGRCSIHTIRPGICRIFPLGRVYEENTFHYILQIHECKNQNRTKVKVSKWIDTKDQKKNEEFIINWHYFLKELQEKVKETKDTVWMKKICMVLLSIFYQNPYEKEKDFYQQYEERMEQMKKVL